MTSLPGNASFPSKLLQIRKVRPTTRARRSIQHLGQPIHHTILMKGMGTLLVRRPNNLFTNFIVSKANGAAVGHGAKRSLLVAQDQNAIRRGFQVRVTCLTIIRLACTFGMIFLPFEIDAVSRPRKTAFFVGEQVLWAIK